MNEIYDLKQKLVQTYMTINHQDHLKRFFTFFDTKVIDKSSPTAKEDIHFMWQSLNNPVDAKLLFRASEHSFKASQFHEKCNSVPDTLTLVKTQFDKVIGGYTHYEWKSTGGFLNRK